jgi:tRNA G18 (ribose-2'-O)-methylase SpoU
MGEVFAIPYARADRWPDALDGLRRDGFRVVALTPEPDARPLQETSYDADDRLAVLLGTEGPGLSEGALRHADDRVRIPMSAGVDSLNVAAAAAVAFWVLGRHEG